MTWLGLALLLLAPMTRPARAEDDDAPPPAEEAAPAEEAPAEPPRDADGGVIDIKAVAKSIAAKPVFDIDHETWRMIGWDDACSVSFIHLSFPQLGQAQVNEPVRTRVGTLSIPPGKEKFLTHVVLEADGELSWDAKKLAKAEKDLKKAGWNRPGFMEVIRSSAIAPKPGLAESILSTATLSARARSWPGPEWRWAGANYAPLSTCALLVFEKRAQPQVYVFSLVRVYNQRARHDRARAHTDNARLLFENGDLDGAVAEAEIGARAAPEQPVNRYHYAAMLALSGHVNQALVELRETVKLSPKYAERARDDEDFADLRSNDDFRAIVERR